MANKVKEYRGHHTMKSAAPRPFIDDEAEMDNYLEKNIYGGEGNHYRKEPALPNPNRTRFTKFEHNNMKKADLLEDYMSSRKDTNLNEQMEIYKKEAKRSILMEGAMKKFFELFELGRTDEEIVLDYANKGVQVPEQFVSKARGQYEGLKKMKLELEMSEKEFKNSAKDIVNNPDEAVVGSDDKPLSSGIYDA